MRPHWWRSLVATCLAIACRHVDAAAPPTTPQPVKMSTPSESRSGPQGVHLTRPGNASIAWVEELGYLEQLIDLWWASRREHQRIDRRDVPSLFAAARVRARTCSTLACYAEVIQSTLCALGDGHLRLESEWWLRQKHYRSGVRFVSTREGIAAANAGAGLEVGDLLLRVDGETAAAFWAGTCEQAGSTPGQRRHNALESLARRTRFGGPPAPLILEVEGRGGRRRTVTLAWQPASEAGGSPPCAEGRMLPGPYSVGYLRVSTFACGNSTITFREQVRDAFAMLETSRHLVVDLRDNGGGRDDSARWLASLLIRRRAEWMRFRHPRPYDSEPTREFFRNFLEPAEEVDLAWPRDARLWFLVGPGCFSTCDTLASVFRAPGVANVTFVGQATAGGVGNPTRFRLPYSGLSVSIPVSLYAMPGQEDDVLIEGRGVAVDLVAVPTVEDLRAGRDAALAVTLNAIAATIRAAPRPAADHQE